MKLERKIRKSLLLMGYSVLSLSAFGNVVAGNSRADVQGVKEVMQSPTKKIVKGFVGDENGEPIIGATVMQKGTGNGVATSLDGTFTLTVPGNATISISYVGYLTKEIPVKERAFIAISLIPNNKVLDEVVVVGFGKQKKESLVGAVQAVKPDDLKMTSSSLTTSFAGNVPGIIARQTKGEPGDDAAEFYIRGISTFGSNTAPLIILDGVEINATMMNNIPPEKDNPKKYKKVESCRKRKALSS